MATRTDQPVRWRLFRSRRLNAIRAFVIVALILVVAGVALYFIVGRNQQATSAPPPPRIPETKTTPAKQEFDLLVNEFMYEDRYVLEAVVPGIEPKLDIDYDPLTRKTLLTISWSPPKGMSSDDKKIYSRPEWQRTAFKRTIPLPEGVSTGNATMKDGILTVTFPRTHKVAGPAITIQK